MRLLIAIALPALAVALVPRDVCNADNCLRAVRATASPTRLLDCSSYLQTTVTPATSTVVSTVTVSTTPEVIISVTDSELLLITETHTIKQTETVLRTTTTTELVNLRKRQATVVPTAIPTYASACSGAVRYSSACSCAGATAKTITASTPLTTVYETVTATPTIITILTTVSTTTIPTTVTTASVTTTDATTTTVSTAVETVSIPAACQNVRSRGQLYTQGAPGRNIVSYAQTYTFADNEQGLSLCCAFCYSTPNCSVFFFSSTGTPGSRRCSLYVNTPPVINNKVSPQCPLGVAPNPSVAGQGNTGFGLGHCWM